ncbi:MAG: multidrug effflux MFS transporter, partial [Acidimicrobiales bacterium]
AGATSVARHWRLVLVIGALSLFGPLCVDAYLPALPQIGRDLGASASAVQLSLTGCLAGLAAGQLVVGPLSDRTGRRPPLLVGIGVFVLSSLACAAAPGVVALDAFRLVQGLSGAAGIVIARALVRDLFHGVQAARFFSALMLVTGLGPIVAPQLGAALLHATSWRGIFVALAAAGAVLLVVSAVKVPEGLPPGRRGPGTVRSAAGGLLAVCRDRTVVGYALIGSLCFGAIFAYVAGSPFVLQNVYGLSPQAFGLAFAANGAGLVLGAQVNGRLVHRLGSERLLTLGTAVMAAGGSAFLLAAATGWGGLPAALASLFAVLFGCGFINPNALALAMQHRPDAAGSASALFGCAQFLLGALAAPLVGLGGSHDALPMGLVVAALAFGAVAVRACWHPAAASRPAAVAGAVEP